MTDGALTDQLRAAGTIGLEDTHTTSRQRQIAELDYATSSRAAMTALAENYVGLPFDDATTVN